MDPFNKFVMQRRAAIGGIVQAAYANSAHPVYTPPVAQQSGAASFGPAIPASLPPALPANSYPAMQPSDVQNFGTPNFLSAGQMIQLQQDSAARAKKAADDKAARDAAIAAAYPAYGSVPQTSVDPLSGATDPQGNPIVKRAPDVWGGGAMTPVASAPLNPAAMASGFGGPLTGENSIAQQQAQIASLAGKDGGGDVMTSAVNAAASAASGPLDAAATAAMKGLPYIDKPRQISTSQMGQLIYDAANGNESDAAQLLQGMPADVGPRLWAMLTAQAQKDKARINDLYDNGATMGGGTVVDPTTGKVAQTGEHIDGGRAVYEKYFQGAIDSWSPLLKYPFRILFDVVADPVTYVLPGTSKAGEALIHSGESLVEQAVRSAAERKVAEEAATLGAKTGATDIGGIAAQAAPDLASAAKVGASSGAEAVADPAVAAFKAKSAATWAAMAPDVQAETAAAAREVLQKTGGLLLQITGHALTAPQEIMDAVAKIAVGTPIKVFQAIIGPLGEASQGTIRRRVMDAAAQAGRDVMNSPLFKQMNDAFGGSKGTTGSLTEADIGQAMRDYRKDLVGDYEVGTANAGKPPAPDVTQPPKRWDAAGVMAENPGMSMKDAVIEANNRNATGARAEYDAAQAAGTQDVGGSVTPTEPVAKVAQDVAPIVGETAPVGASVSAPPSALDQAAEQTFTPAQPGPVIAPEPPLSTGRVPLDTHVTPDAVNEIRTTRTPVGEPGWWDLTKEQRSSAIKRGQITELTPMKNGDRVVDVAYRDYGRSGDPAKYAKWTNAEGTGFNDRYQPIANAFTREKAALDATWFPNNTEKMVTEAVMEAEHVVHDVVPIYRETIGGMPDVAVTAQRALKNGVKQSYAKESEDFLVQRAVYAADAGDADGAIKVLRERLYGAPNKDELLQRIQDARRAFMGNTASERGAAVDYVAQKQTVFALYADGTQEKVRGFSTRREAEQFAAEQQATLAKPRAAVAPSPAVDAAPAAATSNVRAPQDFTTVTSDQLVNDVGQFQMRHGKFDEEGVQRIMDRFDARRLEPLQVRENADGTYTVLGGHNRQEAINRLISRGDLPKDFPIPVKVIRGTDAEIRDIALTSNAKIQLKPTEHANNLRMQIENGKEWKQVLADNQMRDGEAKKYLALNSLPEELKGYVDTGQLSVKQGALLGDSIAAGTIDKAEAASFYLNEMAGAGGLSDTELAHQLKTIAAMKRKVAEDAGGAGQASMFGATPAPMFDFGNDTMRAAMDRSKTLYRDTAKAKLLGNQLRAVRDNAGLSDRAVKEIEGKLRAVQVQVNQAEAELGLPLSNFGVKTVAPKPTNLYFANLADPNRITSGLEAFNQRAGSVLDGLNERRMPSRVSGEISIAAQNDPTILGDMVKEGHITGDSYELMSKRTPNGVSYFDMFDKIAADQGFDEAKTVAAFSWWVARVEGVSTVDRTIIGRFARAFFMIPRGVMQYNWATGWRGVMGDVLGDAFKTFFDGHGAVAADRINPVKYIKTVMHATDQLDEVLAKTGMTMPNLEPVVDRTGATFGEQTPLLKAIKTASFGKIKNGGVGERVAMILTEPFDSRFIRIVRQAGDTVNRRAIFMDTVQKELPRRAQRWLDAASGRMESAGLDPASFEHLPDLFSPQQAREAALAGGADTNLANRIARDWKAELNGAAKAAKTEVNRVLFSFETTKLDDALSNFFFFHYYMSRSYPQYLSMAIRNPEVLAIWYRTWQATERRAQAAGLPDSYVGRIRYMGTMGGFMSSFNPMYTLLPLNPSDLIGPATGQNATLYDKITKVLMPNPAVSVIASFLGLTKTPSDPLMSYAMRRALGTTYNWMRAHGYVGDKSMADAPYDQFLINSQNTVHGWLNWMHVPTGNRWLADDPNAYAKETQAYIARDIVVQDTGVAFNDWTPKEWALWGAANTAIKTQTPGNPIAEHAFRIYQDAMAGNLPTAAIVPGGTKTEYGPRLAGRMLLDAATAAKKAAANVGDLTYQPTTAQVNERDFKTQAQATAGAAPLIEQAREYGDIGTTWQQNLTYGWNDIAFGDAATLHAWSKRTNQPTNYLKIGGQWYSVDELTAPNSKIDRTALADQWVAERKDPVTQTAGPVDLAQIRDEQKAFKTANVTYGEYADWKIQARKYPGGIDAWMTATAAGNPNYAAYLKSSSDPAKFATSKEAYLAWKGQAENIYAAPTQSVRDTSQIPYDAAQTGGGGSGAGTGQTKLSRPDALRKSISDYNAAMTKVAQYLPTDANGKTVDLATLPPNIRSAYLDALRKQGISIPSLPSKISTFYEWKSLQPSGTDTSEEAFFKWLDASQGSSAYDQGLTPAA